MIRKSEDMNFKELNIPALTLNYLSKKGFSKPNEVVNYGRRMALDFEVHPKRAKAACKWQLELISSLNKAGFIRHDLYPTTYCVWHFYKILFREGIANLISNEGYENIPAVNSNQFEAIMEVLGSLSEKEKRVIIVYFGFDGLGLKSLKATGEILHISSENARRVKQKAFRNLKALSRKSKFPALFGFVPPTYQPTIFHTGPVTNLVLDIEVLNFDLRIYGLLKRNGINTIANIINLPEEKWSLISGLGIKSASKIIEKIRAIGYQDFDIKL